MQTSVGSQCIRLFATMTKNNIYFTTLIVFLSILVIEILNSTKPKHPDAGLNTEQLIAKYDYPVEVHEVLTEDGYILTLHRIPHGRHKTHRKKIPIFFMHGLMQSAADFVSLGPGRALCLLLADEGYDVWMGNARGTTRSRRHKSLNPNKDWEYWNYTLHEVGVYDVPAFIDYVLTVTGQEQLHYVGYSQGTSNFFIMTSEKPEYADKVKLMTALAPAIFLHEPKGPAFFSILFFRRFIETFFDVFNVQEFLSGDSLLGFYMKQICNENSVFVDVCFFHLFQLHGYNHEGANKTMLSLVYTNAPAGVSTKWMMHVVQLMDHGQFRRYDWGVRGNLRIYGQEEPPAYDLSKATTPVALYYSSNDWTVNVKNMERVTRTLPNVIKTFQVPSDKFNHNDFVHADNAVEVLYDSVIEEILKY